MMTWHWWALALAGELVVIGVLMWKIHMTDKKRQADRVTLRRYRKAVEEFSEARVLLDEDTHTLLTEPAQICDVCRRLCDPVKDFCHGCGFHICNDCDDEEVIMGPHGFDDHVKGPVPRGEQE